MSKIQVVIGACPSGYDARALAVAQHSILAHTDAEVEFIVRGDNTGSTGFSSVRWSLRNLDGFAIYLDCDVLFFDDIEEIYDLRESNLWLGCVSNGRDTAMPGVVDCANMPKVNSLVDLKAASYYTRGIPEYWNHCDRFDGFTKMLHFTQQNRQPWKALAPKDRAIDKLWLDYEAAM